MTIPEGKKIYFSSDNHLGAPTAAASRPRELRFVKWLDTIKDDAAAIFLLGDLFDFWFEYKHVVPKGFVRTLGKLAEIKDSGIPIYFLDRKSTRLNSSHVKISYAVFCLKKKK